MKQFKRFGALLLALILVLGLGASTALAIDEESDFTPDGTITIFNATQSQTYSIYKIFDATYDKDPDAVAYTYTSTGESDQLYTVLTTSITVTVKDEEENETKVTYTSPFTLTETTVENVYNVTAKDKIDDKDVTEEYVAAFLKACVEQSNLTAVSFGENDSGTVTGGVVGEDDATKVTDNTNVLTFKGLDYGYYYITSTLGSAVTINSAAPSVNVYDKNIGEDPITKPVKKWRHTDETVGGTSDSIQAGDTAVFTVDFKAANFVYVTDKETGKGDYKLIEQYSILDMSSENLDIDYSTISVSIKENGGNVVADDSISYTVYVVVDEKDDRLITSEEGAVDITYGTSYKDEETGIVYITAKALADMYPDVTENQLKIDYFIVRIDWAEWKNTYVDGDGNTLTVTENTTNSTYSVTINGTTYDNLTQDTDGNLGYTDANNNNAWVVVAYQEWETLYDAPADVTITYSAQLVSNYATNQASVRAIYLDDDGGTDYTTDEGSDTDYLYNWTIQVTKYDGATASEGTNGLEAAEGYDEIDYLSGAKFILYRYALPTTTGDVTTYSFYDENDNTYTADDAESNSNLVKLYYQYTEPEDADDGDPDVDWVAVTGNYTTVTTKDGLAYFYGLEPGTYYLVETKAPDGYNLLSEEKEITLSVEDEDDLKDNNGDLTEGEVAALLTYKLSIPNNAGTLLPETGGMGTTILYAIGIILVLGAGILLVVRRRMSVDR